jgi:cell fate regulator YaaT (PSP1 superfamily)
MTCACPRAVASVHQDWVRVVVDPDVPAIPCRAGSLELTHGEPCVVELPEGLFIGHATIFCCPVLRNPLQGGGRIVRQATEEDLERQNSFASLQADIEAYLRQRVRALGLEIKPLKVRIPLSGRKAIVSFTAEQRVDFRPLLKELGGRFRRRIEMRPHGVRDGAKLCGGLGPCGRSLCCSTFMARFHSVTVRMAKRQNLSLNPAKISGLCGRLMCCLAHEVELYPQRTRRGSKHEPAAVEAPR